ncbi:MAG: TIGR04211 family SH3 domain-containing protein [Thiohalomonadaceae bacterium]
MCRRMVCGLFVLVMLWASAVSAEFLYVHDELRLGVRPQPNSTDTPLAVVTTGARLEALDRSGSFVKVRTSRGIEGWVSAAYLSEEKPARLLLEELRESHEAVLLQLAEREQGMAAMQAENADQAERIEAMLDNEVALMQQIEQYRAELGHGERSLAWIYQTLLMLLLFLSGVFLGVKWYRHRISERMGGLEI